MKLLSTRLLAVVVAVVVISGMVFMRMLERPPAQASPKSAARQVPPPPAAPPLLPARQGTLENPLQSWERLLAEDGSPAEDRAALADIVTHYLQSTANQPRPPLGPNEEITRALTDSAAFGDSAIPPDHPAIVSGQLVDRWGSPWFFHQLSADVMEVRGAGADRILFTGDDVVK